MYERVPNPSDPYMSPPTQPSQASQPSQPNPTTTLPNPWDYVGRAERIIGDFTARMMHGPVVGNPFTTRQWDLPEAPLFAWQQAANELCVAIEQVYAAYSYRQLTDADTMRALRYAVSTGIARLRPGLAIPGFWTGSTYQVLINQRFLANAMRMHLTQTYEDYRQVFGSVFGM